MCCAEKARDVYADGNICGELWTEDREGQVLLPRQPQLRSSDERDAHLLPQGILKLFVSRLLFKSRLFVATQSFIP